MLLAVSAAGQSSDTARRVALEQTVLDQLAAFRRGDWTAAYGFASQAIQGRFTPEAFREMVTQGYAAIADSIGALVVQVLDQPAEKRGYVEVEVEGRNGQTVEAGYELVEEQGAWKINSVVVQPVRRPPLPRA